MIPRAIPRWGAKYMPFKKIILSIGFVFLTLGGSGLLLTTAPAPAQAIPKIECVSFLPGCKILRLGWSGDYKENVIFEELLPKGLKWLFRVSAAIAVLMGVVAGVMFVLGGGNDGLRTRATKTVIYAIGGLLLSMFAYFIVSLVERFPFPGAG